MKLLVAFALFASILPLSGCGKKHAATQSAPSPALAPAPVAQAVDSTPAAPSQNPVPSQDDPERAKKEAALQYATMEDQYMNDPHAQWASSASASSTFGDDNGRKPSDVNMASNVVGAVDGRTWTNNHQDIGFDWLQVGFDKPVSATEVRVVFAAGEGAEAVNKVEVQDAQGQWVTVWSGLSDVKVDKRGPRTWFVRKFDKTSSPTKAVKITIANNVQSGYKVVDAVQLVGE